MNWVNVAGILAATALMVASAVMLAGCSGDFMGYDHSPENIVIQANSNGGGIPLPGMDSVPGFRLFGDGRVIKWGKGDCGGLLVEGRLEEGQVRDLIARIEGTGFFRLKDEYVDIGYCDGGSSNLSVNLDTGKKTVHVYMVEVKPYEAAFREMLDYPIGETEEHVPRTGYLVVEEERSTGEESKLDEELSDLLPDYYVLESAAENNRPVAIDGEDFVKIKRIEVEDGGWGIVVDTGESVLTIYPNYKP